MPRQLKTYTTSIGFFDLAVAAPSMKAALEAWGAGHNLFHHGLAEESDDASIVAATMAQPGVVLRRAVGSNNSFKVNAELPRSLPVDSSGSKTKKTAKPHSKTKPSVAAKRNKAASALTEKAQKAAVIEFEKEKARRQKAREKEEGEREKQKEAEAREEEKRQKAVDKAERILERARARHASRLETLEKEVEAAEARLHDEGERWKNEEAQLQRDIQKAGR